MPRQNGTGPAGMGAGTGRGMGPCAMPTGRQGAGMGYGRKQTGGGRGLGWRRFWGYYPSQTVSKKEESEILSEDAKYLEEELKATKNRLEELENQK